MFKEYYKSIKSEKYWNSREFKELGRTKNNTSKESDKEVEFIRAHGIDRIRNKQMMWMIIEINFMSCSLVLPPILPISPIYFLSLFTYHS